MRVIYIDVDVFPPLKGFGRASVLFEFDGVLVTGDGVWVLHRLLYVPHVLLMQVRQPSLHHARIARTELYPQILQGLGFRGLGLNPKP